MTVQPTQGGANAIAPAGCWAGGAATAIVAALIAVVGILLARGVFDVPVLAPEGEGTWGDADTLKIRVYCAVAALVATGLLHLLLSSRRGPCSSSLDHRAGHDRRGTPPVRGQRHDVIEDCDGVDQPHRRDRHRHPADRSGAVGHAGPPYHLLIGVRRSTPYCQLSASRKACVVDSPTTSVASKTPTGSDARPVGTTQQLGDGVVDPAEIQPAADGVEGGGVVLHDLDERRANGCPAAHPQYDGWCLGAGRVGQFGLKSAEPAYSRLPYTSRTVAR